MDKPASLRKKLADTFTVLKDHPDKLTIYIIAGSINGQKYTLGHTEKYTMRVLLTDWPTPMQEVTVTILSWMQEHQPQKLLQGNIGNETMRYEAEIIDNNLADLLYELDITEKVVVKVADNGDVEILAQTEPQADDY